MMNKDKLIETIAALKNNHSNINDFGRGYRAAMDDVLIFLHYKEPAECVTFVPDELYTSVTKCKNCGKEKYEHKYSINL